MMKMKTKRRKRMRRRVKASRRLIRDLLIRRENDRGC
jgi:hypothetical protein